MYDFCCLFLEISDKANDESTLVAVKSIIYVRSIQLGLKQYF